jgi:hypothetical protein
MTDYPRKSRPTMIGLPAPLDCVAVPLTPYRDVALHTPSHARRLRERGESTPVFIPPARRHTPEEVAMIRRARLAPPTPMHRPVFEPRFWTKALVCMVVIYATLIVVFGVL